MCIIHHVGILAVTLMVLPPVFSDSAVKGKDTNDLSSCKSPIPQQRSAETQIDHIFLLGERNSGTNFIAGLIYDHFYGKYNLQSYEFLNPATYSHDNEAQMRRKMTQRNATRQKLGLVGHFDEGHSGIGDTLTNTPLGYKHMWGDFSQEKIDEVAATYRENAVWLMVVRDPCSWANGMYKLPWHMCNQASNSTCSDRSDITLEYRNQDTDKSKANYMTRLDFMKHTFGDNRMKRVSERLHLNATFMYQNIFELRKEKLQYMCRIASVFPHVKIVDLKLAELSPSHFIAELVQEFGLTTSPPPKVPLMDARPHELTCFSREEFDFVQATVDWEKEGHFGHNPHDCHTCLG